MNINLCRVCLKTDSAVSIFDADKNNVRYSTKILTCVNISLYEDDGLPSRICKPCIEELSVAFHFIQKCMSSDSTLRNYKVNENDILSEQTHVVTEIKKELDNGVKLECEIKSEKCNVNETDIFDDAQYDDYSTHEDTVEVDTKRKKNSTSNSKKSRPPKSGPVQCTECGKMVNTRSVLILHMRTHTGERPYSCDECGAQFKLKGTLARHLLKHDRFKQVFICEICGKKFASKGCIITHLKIHNSVKNYLCPYCPKQFRQHASLYRHKKTHSAVKPYLCPICGKAFRDKNQVKKHTRNVHTNDKNFICQHCSKGFKSPDTLKAHIQYTHTSDIKYVCNFCGMVFKAKGGMKTHIQRRHSQKSGTCDVCFKVCSNLEVHMYKHSGERPFACAKCDQAFYTKRSLAYHISIKHENVAKFKCSVEDCKKTFPILPMLEFHLAKEHNHKTTHKCPHCARGFYRLCDLSKHVKSSHMDKPLDNLLSTVIK